eukprot:6817853-Ditylum_brightwellii.AAC.1
MDQNNSNYRELKNAVDGLESEGTTGRLTGSSASQLIHQEVLGLRKLEIGFGCKIHLIHYAGIRMIAQGTDGLSRASQVSPTLIDWVRSWVGQDLITLEPDDWFEQGNNIAGDYKDINGMWYPRLELGSYLWEPAPAVVATGIKELRKAQHKRQRSSHI